MEKTSDVLLSTSVVLTLNNLGEVEALRTVLGLSHLIPKDAYDSRGLNQEKVENYIVPVYRRLEDSFGGFHDFSEEGA